MLVLKVTEGVVLPKPKCLVTDCCWPGYKVCPKVDGASAAVASSTERGFIQHIAYMVTSVDVCVEPSQCQFEFHASPNLSNSLPTFPVQFL